jgi:hypothetical protein
LGKHFTSNVRAAERYLRAFLHACHFTEALFYVGTILPRHFFARMSFCVGAFLRGRFLRERYFTKAFFAGALFNFFSNAYNEMRKKRVHAQGRGIWEKKTAPPPANRCIRLALTAGQKP